MAHKAKSENPIVVFLLVLVIAGAFYYYLTKKSNTAPRNAVAVGVAAPEIKAAGWVNGEPGDLTGKVILVEAWATWCGPCRREAPHVVATWKKFEGRDDVVFIGLTTEPKESLPQIEAFLQQAGITWSNGYGADETLTALKAEYIPASWVINKQGNISWTSNSRIEMADAIQNALDQ